MRRHGELLRGAWTEVWDACLGMNGPRLGRIPLLEAKFQNWIGWDLRLRVVKEAGCWKGEVMQQRLHQSRTFRFEQARQIVSREIYFSE